MQYQILRKAAEELYEATGRLFSSEEDKEEWISQKIKEWTRQAQQDKSAIVRLGKFVQAFRQQCGFSGASQFAAQVKISTEELACIEKGITLPPEDFEYRLYHAFHFSEEMKNEFRILIRKARVEQQGG